MDDALAGSTKFCVVGAGVMGSGITQVLATSGFEVKVYESVPERRPWSKNRILESRFGLISAKDRGLISGRQVDEILDRIRYSSSLSDACGDADIVVEAVPEEPSLKVEVFQELDHLSPESAVLTSNTAGLSIEGLAAPTKRPSRVVGWHWAQPTPVMRLAEIVVHGSSDPSAVELVQRAARACGKNPVVIRDSPTRWGFVSNRISRVIREEASAIVREGVATPSQVDEIMKDCFRWPLGPFEGSSQDVLDGSEQVAAS